jgi:hypothetical protein
MVQIKSAPDEFSAEYIEIHIADPDLKFSKAKDLSKEKARERCKDPMLLSWYNGKTGEFYPRFDCGSGDKPAWVVFAEARGGNLTIDINDGEYIFIYLKL